MHNPIQILISFSIVASVLLVGLSADSEAQSTGYEQAFRAYQTQKFDEAETIWIELANAGDVNAQYALGVMHLREEASDSNPAAAFSWFEKASNQGHATAMFNLGVAYWEGTGVNQDKAKALSLWEQSANKGDSGAQFNLGLAYYIGEERSADLAEASKWISQAADQGHPEATRILAVINSELTNNNSELTNNSGGVASNNTNATAGSEAALTTTDESSLVATDNIQSASTAQPTKLYWKSADSEVELYDQANGTAFGALQPGTPLEIMGQDGGWARVTLPDGLRTWIYSKFINIDEDHGIITADSVRVRPIPSTNNSKSPPLGKYRRGDRVLIIGSEGDWVEIRAPKQIGAWLRVQDIIEYKDTESNRALQWQQAVADGM